MEFAGWIAIALLGVITLFQLALALGAPWGSGAWGGTHHGVLPARYRVASGAVGLVVYPSIIWYLFRVSIADTGCVADCGPFSGNSNLGLWILAALFGLGALMNFVSPSHKERRWGPVALVISLACVAIALTG